jgi:hypothetical protein
MAVSEMSEQQLRRMLEIASVHCERVFAREGEVVPMWHAVCANGDHLIEPHPTMFEKPLAAALMRALFDVLDVARCVYVGEGWVVDVRGSDSDPKVKAALEAARRGRVDQHPDRVEIVMLMGEDRDAGMISAHRRIVRPENRKPYLGALEIVTRPGDGVQSSGRMVGMLPARGTRQ